jgi:phospholipid/cholesterol/gamma-HCH transport system substrate-binding protein
LWRCGREPRRSCAGCSVAGQTESGTGPRAGGLADQEGAAVGGISIVARAAAGAALALAVLFVGYMLLRGGSSYTVTAEFTNASQLVTGNQVDVAGTPVGTVSDISLGPRGTALVKMSVGAGYAPLHRGTTATIRSQSLSGVANRFVQLEMPSAAQRGPAIPDGGMLPLADTTSEVDLDQLFNTLDARTVGHLKQLVRGFATAYDGVGKPTNRGFHYFNPFLSTSRRLFDELTLDSNRFQRLIVDTSTLSGALASRSSDLTNLVSNTDRMMGAIGSQNRALAAAVGELPNFMRNFNTTAVNLRATLDDLDPLVNASKPVARRLGPFIHQLRGFATDAVPTINDLQHTVSRPGPNNDLIELTRLQVPLAHIAAGPVQANGATRQGALPESNQSLVGGLPALAFLRPYVTTEGLSGWFDDFAHSGIYDADGVVGRIENAFNQFSLSGPGGTPNLLSPPLTTLPQQQSAGLSINNLQRCPGANERNPGDNSTPFTDNGQLACNPSEVPIGP